MPVSFRTRKTIFSANFFISSALAPPVFTSTIGCLSKSATFPLWNPFRPHTLSRSQARGILIFNPLSLTIRPHPRLSAYLHIRVHPRLGESRGGRDISFLAHQTASLG